MTIITPALQFTVLIYSIFFDCRMLMIFFAIMGIYLLFYFVYYSAEKGGSGRKKLAMALWSPPTEGLIKNRVQIDATNILNYMKTKKAQDAHVTITHICIKAVAQALNAGRNNVNGKIVFGKFIPFDTVDVSCLVDVGGGQDLASILVENADKKSFEEIADYINNRARKAKKGQDEEHKARSGPLKFFPPFLIGLVIQLTSFITYNLGLTIKPLHLKKHCFGAATVTSIGAFGFKDVFVPFTPMMRNSFIVAVNQIQEVPLVKNGQIVARPVLNLNFTTDHRFMDGGAVLKSNQALHDVFENPEKYGSK